MLHLKAKDLKRFTRPGDFQGWGDSRPAPFPGDSPVRIAWQLKPIGGKLQEYLGKPTKATVDYFNRQMRNVPMQDGWIIEFDRTHRPIYVSDIFHGTHVHPTLFPAYHFWQSFNLYADHFGVPLFRKKLSGLTVFSPYRTLTPERIRDWHQYIARNVRWPIKLGASL